MAASDNEQELRDLAQRVAQTERDIAENRHDLRNARQVTDIKLERISADITDLKNALKWAGGLIISLMLSFMAWAALQQFNANETQKKDLEEQINLIKSQESAAKDRARILEEIRANEGRASEDRGTATTRDDASVARDANSDDLPNDS